MTIEVNDSRSPAPTKSLLGTILMTADFRSETPTAGVWSEIIALPIGALHLGVQAEAALTTIGVETIIQAVDRSVGGGVVRKALGPRGFEMLGLRMQALLNAAETGSLDWDKYCQSIRVRLLPSLDEIDSGEKFLAVLPQLIEDVADTLADSTDARILRDRIARPWKARSRLEAIAKSEGISRERVRQRESKLLERLAAAFIGTRYGNLSFHFTEPVTRYWRTAAAQFGGRREIGLPEFISVLGSAWGVRSASLLEQLPLVLAIVTADSHVPEEFRGAMDFASAYSLRIDENTRAIQFTKLRVASDADVLTNLGIRTVGDFMDACVSNGASSSSLRVLSRALEHVVSLAACCDATGEVMWDAYMERFGLESVPPISPISGEEFLGSLAMWLEQILRRDLITIRAAEIFRLRTGRSEVVRPSLKEVAAALNTYGSEVKREETIFLAYLYDLLVDRHFSRSDCWLDSSWLSYWREAKLIFDKHGSDRSVFLRELKRCWSLQCTADSAGHEIVWAVLTGFPTGGRGRRKARIRVQATAGDEHAPVKIKLKGFRTFH